MRISDWSSDVCSSDLMFFVFDDGSIVTPPLTGTILPGITRDAIITLARDAGLTVREEGYAIDQWQADAQSGRLTESFACGTAAVVTPVGKVTRGDANFTSGAGGPGQVTEMLQGKLIDIQRGRAADPPGWVTRLCPALQSRPPPQPPPPPPA